MLQLLWLIPALPAAGFLLLTLLNRRLSRTGRGLDRRRVRRPRGARRPARLRQLHRLAAGRRRVPPGPVDLDGRRRLRAQHRLLPRRRQRHLGAGHHLRRLPHPPVLHRAHGARRGLHPVLHVPEPLRRLHAHPGAGRQPAAAVPRLGGRGPLQLPAHLVLAEGPAERVQRPQGVHRHPRGRHGADRRAVPAVHATGHAADPADARRRAGARSCPARRWPWRPRS